MAKAVTFQISESDADKLESLIDATLAALRNLEETSVARDARIEQSQARTAQLMDEIELRLSSISELNANRKSFPTSLSLE